MDQTTRRLAEYVAGLRYADLPAATVAETRLRLADTLGCALGGFDAEPSAIARTVAAAHGGTPAARVLGTGQLTSMEMAAFVNCVMARYLDFNDTYISRGSGHPSDMIPACLAVAEGRRASGRETLVAIAAAYEVFTALADQVPLRDRGWDQGVFVVLGVAAGVAKLLGLSVEQIADALAIAVTAHVPTRQTRSGELAMWKGCATAAAARGGVFAALLAQAGMTGPTAAFEGRHGVWDQVSGRFTLGALGGQGVAFGIERTNLKFFPSEYHSQAPLWMALSLREQVAAADIDAIEVETYHTAWHEIGSEPEKWNPQTRETADHSLPYLLALGFIDGRIRADSFSAARMRDPAVHALMSRIRIRENEAFTRAFPARMISEIRVTARDGRRLTETASYPKGHANNPMTAADVERKFRQLAGDVMETGAVDALLAKLAAVDALDDIAGLIDLVRVRG